jgi:hypothetical protein
LKEHRHTDILNDYIFIYCVWVLRSLVPGYCSKRARPFAVHTIRAAQCLYTTL